MMVVSKGSVVRGEEGGAGRGLVASEEGGQVYQEW